VITAENVEWLRSFPLQLSIEGLRVVHGGWSDPLDEYLKGIDTLLLFSFWGGVGGEGERLNSKYEHLFASWSDDDIGELRESLSQLTDVDVKYVAYLNRSSLAIVGRAVEIAGDLEIGSKQHRIRLKDLKLAELQ